MDKDSHTDKFRFDGEFPPCHSEHSGVCRGAEESVIPLRGNGFLRSPSTTLRVGRNDMGWSKQSDKLEFGGVQKKLEFYMLRWYNTTNAGFVYR